MTTLLSALNEMQPKYASRLAELYVGAIGEPPSWENLTKANLLMFTKELQEHLSQNSAKTYAGMLKSVINAYSDQVELPDGWEKILRIRAEASVSTWLTDDEIQLLIDCDNLTMTQRLVRDQFVMGCLTGARHGDYIQFTAQNIVNGNLVYVSQKTGIRSEMPCSPAVQRILERENIKKQVTTMHFNRIIKALCKYVGITSPTKVFHAGQMLEGEKWHFVSSHTARRSFATNVYLRCRDIFLVSRYMGHSSVDMTAKYILSIGDAPDEVKQYFEQFK